MTKFNKNKHVSKVSNSKPIIPQTEKMKESLSNIVELPVLNNAPKWEYLCKWIEKIDEKILDSHGSEGWELINFIGTHGGFNFIFKRPL